jgi:lipopolysaccharide/colanic/teichoic acid biosynthesis glycosyltransferase
LRKSSIDELPQLINVLRGDMSLIGPRPCMPYEAEEFLQWQVRRFDAMPGMTGLWQVSGKNHTTSKKIMRLDISYARRPSFWTDLRIMLKTAPAVLQQLTERASKGWSKKYAGDAGNA